MKQYIFGLFIAFLFVAGCSEKKDTIEVNTWNKFKEIPNYTNIQKTNKVTSVIEYHEDADMPPAEMPLVVSTFYRDGYNDAFNSVKPTAKVSNQKDYLEGFQEGTKDKNYGVKKRLIVR